MSLAWSPVCHKNASSMGYELTAVLLNDAAHDSLVNTQIDICLCVGCSSLYIAL